MDLLTDQARTVMVVQIATVLTLLIFVSLAILLNSLKFMF